MNKGPRAFPVELFIGSQASTLTAALQRVQGHFCLHGGCNACRVCQQITERRFYSCRWLVPAKQQYTRVDVEGIMQQLTLALDAEQHYFFVIESAELLTAAVANSLLKSLEEPPTGYHFILLTDRPALLLPTVRSRCVERDCGGEATARYEPLLALLRQPRLAQAVQFSEQLTAADITEQETLFVLDELVRSWPRVPAVGPGLEVVLAAYQELPMPGSAKLFWRSLFLKLVLAHGS